MGLFAHILGLFWHVLHSSGEADGQGWQEKWRQILDEGVEKGTLSGFNMMGDRWEEEWETAALKFDCQ